MNAALPWCNLIRSTRDLQIGKVSFREEGSRATQHVDPDFNPIIACPRRTYIVVRPMKTPQSTSARTFRPHSLGGASNPLDITKILGWHGWSVWGDYETYLVPKRRPPAHLSSFRLRKTHLLCYSDQSHVSIKANTHAFCSFNARNYFETWVSYMLREVLSIVKYNYSTVSQIDLICKRPFITTERHGTRLKLEWTV